MTRNNNSHEFVRSQLPLAAAGALSHEELRVVTDHASACESCRRELEVWGLYGKGLQQLPQPVIPADLFARTHRSVLRDRAESLERRRNAWMLCALAVFSWVTSFGFWIVVRALTGGTLEVLGANLVDAGPWILFSSILTWITAGVAAATLGSQRYTRRFQ